MKEKEIRLTSEELDYLLKGTIHWEDISSRGEAPLRKPVDAPSKRDDRAEDFRTRIKNQNQGWDKDYTKNLKGHNKDHNKDYSIDVEINYDQKFLEEEQSLEENWSFEEARPFWSGSKVYILLTLVGGITLGTWAYFVFA